MKGFLEKFFKFVDNLNPSSFIAGNLGGIVLLTLLLRIPNIEEYLYGAVSLKILANFLFFSFLSIIVAVPILIAIKNRKAIIRVYTSFLRFEKKLAEDISLGIIKLFAIFLTPVVKYIVTYKLEVEKGEKFIILSCEEKYEDYYPKLFDLENEKEIRFKILPLEGDYWRVGLVLSNDKKFGKKLHSLGQPLVYISKEEHEKKIKVDYFDENNRHVTLSTIILAKYSGGEDIELVYRKRDKFMEFEAIVEGESSHKTHIPEEFKYAKLLAWADRIAHDPHFKIKIIRVV